MSISSWNAYWAGILAIFWGIVLLFPGDLFEGIERYDLMREIFPDWTWGVLYVLFGFLILLPLSTTILKHLHWLLSALWLGMTILSVLGSASFPALLIASLTFFVAIIHVGKFWRLSHPATVKP